MGLPWCLISCITDILKADALTSFLTLVICREVNFFSKEEPLQAVTRTSYFRKSTKYRTI